MNALQRPTHPGRPAPGTAAAGPAEVQARSARSEADERTGAPARLAVPSSAPGSGRSRAKKPVPQHVATQALQARPVARPDAHVAVQVVDLEGRAPSRQLEASAPELLDPRRPGPRDGASPLHGGRLQARQRFDRGMGAPGPVYLVSTAVAVATAITGHLVDPRNLQEPPVRVATGNVNSLRARMDHVRRFTDEGGCDVICLQETKPVDVGLDGLGVDQVAVHRGVVALVDGVEAHESGGPR